MVEGKPSNTWSMNDWVAFVARLFERGYLTECGITLDEAWALPLRGNAWDGGDIRCLEHLMHYELGREVIRAREAANPTTIGALITDDKDRP